MKTLNIYVAKNFLITFVMAMGVLTFGMMGARLIKIFEFVSKGVPLEAICMFFVYIMPLVLTLAIPWSCLVTIMLIFGRMSADSEITAMRACGISVLQIISPIIIITFLLTCLCLYLQLDVEPTFTFKARNLLYRVGVDQPLSMLEPGRPIEFEGNHIYIDDRVGTNGLKDIQVFKMGKNNAIEQDVTAARGRVEADKEKQLLNVILENATTVTYDANGAPPTRVFSEKMIFSIDYGKTFNRDKIGREINYLSFVQLFGKLVLEKERRRDTTRLEVELNQRIALALSPIAFMLLGIPLAIRTSRKETSIGLFLSVILSGGYFCLVMICNALSNYPQYYPQIILWIPNVLFQMFGIVFIFRIARK